MSTQAPILATRDLGLDIGGARIVADVSLEVPAGELVGIIGPNGAGKTTLFNLLSGTVRPTTGSVELDGKDVTRDPPHRRTQAGLGRSFQVSSVFPLLSVGENVRLAADYRNKLVAHVRVALPLEPKQRERLTAALSELYGKRVHLNVDVDPSVLGGIRVEIGDEVLDGTVARRLDDVRRQLAR